MEQTLESLRTRIAEAAAAGRYLRLRGGGSKDWYGRAGHGELLDTRAYRGVAAYEPTELVVTVRCGTPLAELEALLAAQRQMLPFEPPHFGPDATVGGMIASGLSGPRRQSAGAVRDYVLGMTVIDGRGRLLRFGGQVMKNVAGYDVSRLMAGSMGVLGLIAEVSLKVLPMPVAETTLRFELDEEQAILQLNRWGGQPLPLASSAWLDGVLYVRLSGAGAAVANACRVIGGEPAEAAIWSQLREHAHPWFSFDESAQTLWRLALPSATRPLALPGSWLIEWGGGLRWLKTDAPEEAVRALAAEVGGHATRFRGADRYAHVFHPLSPALARVHRNLKRAFDPAGILNPGRLYPDL